MQSKTLFKDILSLVSGAVLAKAIAFLVIPILTRLYTPEQFGVYTITITTITIFGSLCSLRYCDAIPIPKSNILATQLTLISFILIVPLSAILTFLYFIYSADSFTDLPDSYYFFLYIGILLYALYETASFLAIRRQKYKSIAFTNITQSILGSVIKVGFGYLSWLTPLGLVIGGCLQQGAGVIYLLKENINEIFYQAKKLNKKKVRLILSRYSDYPKFRLSSRLALLLSQNIPIIYFTYVFGLSASGQLGLAFSTISIPAALIANNVRKVYYGNASKVGENNYFALKELTRSVILKMFSISIIPVSILIIFSKPLFSFVYGEGWELAANIAALLSIQLLGTFVAGSIIDYFNVVGKVKIYFYINLFRVLLVSICFSLSYFLKLDELESILIFTLTIFSIMILQVSMIIFDINKGISNGR